MCDHFFLLSLNQNMSCFAVSKHLWSMLMWNDNCAFSPCSPPEPRLTLRVTDTLLEMITEKLTSQASAQLQIKDERAA